MNYLLLSTVFASAVLALPSLNLGAQIRIKRPVVVVYPLEINRVRLQVKAAAALGQYLIDRLAATRTCRVIPQSKLKKILRKQKRPAHRRCLSQECQVRVAGLLGASEALVARIVRIGSHCIVTANLYGVKKKKPRTFVVTVKGRCDEDGLLESVEEVVVKIGRRLSPDLWPYGGKVRAR